MSEPIEPWKWGDDVYRQPVKHPIDLHPAGTRFLATGYDAALHVFDKGDWVRYIDYESLQKENARLQSEVTKWKSWAEAEHAEKKALAGNVSDLAKLKAEVELLSIQFKKAHYDQLITEVERLRKLVPSEDDINRGGYNP